VQHGIYFGVLFFGLGDVADGGAAAASRLDGDNKLQMNSYAEKLL
jgi:hypothetical protein